VHFKHKIQYRLISKDSAQKLGNSKNLLHVFIANNETGKKWGGLSTPVATRLVSSMETTFSASEML
jgi:hypothetical protein